MKKIVFIFSFSFLFAITVFAQKGIGVNGFITESGSGNPVGGQKIIIAIDSTVFPYVVNLHHVIYSHPDGSFSFYEPNVPYSSFPLKVLIYTYDCEYQRTGYEVTYYYDNVIADSILIDVCTQNFNPVSIGIDSNNTSCPTYIHLENNGVSNWPHIYEEFTWSSNGEIIGTGSEIDYFFEEQYNDISLHAMLKDSLTGFVIDSLSTYSYVDFPQSYFNIFAGNVLSGTCPVETGTAILLRQCNNNFEHIDTLNFDTLGYYYFQDIPRCNYSVKIINATQQGTNISVIPTYLNDKLHWSQCSHVLLTQDEFQQDINLYTAQNLYGPGHITGYITPQPNMIHDVILYNTSMEPLFSTSASEDGVFEFSYLPFGTYIIYSERYGYNSMSNTVNINQDEPNAVVYLQQATGISETENNVLSVFPNPADRILFVDGDFETVDIFDSKGSIVYSGNHAESGIDISGFSSGVYIVCATSADGTQYFSKFLKK